MVGPKLPDDGSSRVIQGQRHNGSSVADGSSSLLEAGRLSNNWSVQTWELYALNQALKMLTGKEGMIYMTLSMPLEWYVPLEKSGWREC